MVLCLHALGCPWAAPGDAGRGGAAGRGGGREAGPPPAVVDYMRNNGCPVDWERVRERALRNVGAVHPRVKEVVQRGAEVVAAARGSRWWVELHREREYQRLWALGGGKSRKERREF